MYGSAGGFVDDDDAGILIDDAACELVEQPAFRQRRLAGNRAMPRRNPHDVRGVEPIVGFDPAAVHSHLALAQHSVDAAAWYAGHFTQQKIVDALPFGITRLHQANASRATRSAIRQLLSLTIEVLRRRCYIPSALPPGAFGSGSSDKTRV